MIGQQEDVKVIEWSLLSKMTFYHIITASKTEIPGAIWSIWITRLSQKRQIRSPRSPGQKEKQTDAVARAILRHSTARFKRGSLKRFGDGG
jgi:hypothetical protein